MFKCVFFALKICPWWSHLISSEEISEFRHKCAKYYTVQEQLGTALILSSCSVCETNAEHSPLSGIIQAGSCHLAEPHDHDFLPCHRMMITQHHGPRNTLGPLDQGRNERRGCTWPGCLVLGIVLGQLLGKVSPIVVSTWAGGSERSG